MKILYGIQGTGNGHISRARALLPEFRKAGADVTCHFSGRAKDQFFGMEMFEPYLISRGLSFATRDGKIDYLKTAFHTHARTFIRDMRALDLDAYDAIVVDYEPVTAEAAHHAGRESIGVGNQYAYLYDVPKDKKHVAASAVMNRFAPVTHPLGVHWHHFNQPILPPITNPPEAGIVDPKKILVYMGFEKVGDMVDFVAPVKDREFYIYSPQNKRTDDRGNIHLRPLSPDGFRHDLATCARVVCNAGFELPTEAMALGRPVLIKPLEHQMEQEANAAAIVQLGYGDAMEQFDPAALKAWLAKDSCVKIAYPNVAEAIAQWVVKGDYANTTALVHDLWDRTTVARVPAPG